jgi:acetyl-CoA carboxylase carboxyltransferase component
VGEVRSPLQGTVVTVADAGDTVHARTTVVVVESMKMEHAVEAGVEGTVAEVLVVVGQQIAAGDLLARIEPGAAGAVEAVEAVEASAPAVGGVRRDLAEVLERHAAGLDAARPAAVERRRRTGQRTARENVEDLLDPGSFVEYGPVVIAAQRRRRPVDDLIANTPADGLVSGIGTVDGHQVAVLSYDYTVLAGTQGLQNHRKKDRLFELIERQRLPVVFFAEGGGGRPGDTDGTGVSGLDCLAFWLWGGLSGLVPMIGITSGRCFAGNAAILGCCDVIIATEGSNIGMGGPAMIEGGGLGVYAPEDVGPLDVQVANGVVDVAVADEADAVAVARRYVGYFTGPVEGWVAPPVEALREVVPENRRQAYDVRAAVHGIADEGSVLELRAGFGLGMVTALARVEGKPLGIVANNPTHLAGAIDADGADKAARFLQLCDAHDLPVLFLCDTPGIMVGPEAETRGTVRHASRLFVTGANLSVPFGTIVLRKGYGLGAQAMAGGSFKAPLFCISWPTGEFGGMGLEGAVRLGYRKELEAIEDPEAREAAFQDMVDRMYEHGKALNAASHFEIDDVIDPADSRRWISTLLLSRPPTGGRGERKRRPGVDPW